MSISITEAETLLLILQKKKHKEVKKPKNTLI